MKDEKSDLLLAVTLIEKRYNRLRIKFNLLIVSVAATVIFLAFNGKYDKILTVERLNIIEPNGKLRMVLSNRAASPGNLFYGKEFIKGGNRSGMIFYNDEETECGGLVFDGRKDSITNKSTAFGHLSFDQYNQNQVVYLSYGDEDGKRSMGLNIDEWQEKPSFKEWREQIANIYTKTSDTAMQRKLYEKLLYPDKDKRAFSKRAFLGRDEDENASLVLYDKLNRKRLIINVDSLGIPVITFLDKHGKITKMIK